MNKSAATLFGTLLVATTFATVGCGDDDRDAFNDVVLPPTSTVSLTTSTTTSNGSSSTSTAPTPVALGVTLDQGVLAVDATNAAGVILFPGASVVAPAANTSYAGSSFVVSLPAGATGLTLTAPASSIGTVTGSGTQTVSVTLNASATATQVQSFLRAIRVVSNSATFGQTATVTVTATGPNAAGQTQTVTNTGRSVRVQAAAALRLTVDGSQASDPAANRYQTLQAAVDAVAGAGTGTNEGRQGSQIVLPAGTYTFPQLQTSKRDGIRALQLASYGVVNIGVHASDETADPDLAGLTISGPNATMSAGSVPGTRAPEAVLRGGLVIGAPNVRLQGVTIEEGGTSSTEPPVGIRADTGGRNLTVSNVIFTATQGNPTYSTSGVIAETFSTGSDNAGLSVLGSAFTGWYNGVSVQAASDLPNRRSGDVVDGCFFTGSVNAGVYFAGADNETVSNSVFRTQAPPVSGAVAAHIAASGASGVGVTASNNWFDASGDIYAVLTANTQLKLNFQRNYWNSASGPAVPGQGHPAVVQFYPNDVTNNGTLASDTSNFLTTNPFPGR